MARKNRTAKQRRAMFAKMSKKKKVWPKVRYGKNAGKRSPRAKKCR